MLYSFDELLFSASLAVYVAICVAAAAVRWGHKCEPYAHHIDYYFPAWRVLVFCFATSLLLVPAVFLPREEDSVLQVRMVLIMSSTFYCAAIMFSYFGKVLKVNWWRKPIVAVSVPFSLMMISACVFTILPGTQLEGAFCRQYFSVAGILSVIFLICFILAVMMIVKALRRFSQENYSNPDDFPRHYALRVIWIPVAHVAISWTVTFIGSLPALSIGMLLLSVVNVVFIIGALSPHRAQDVKSLEAESARARKLAEGSMSKEYKDELLRTIRHYVEDEKAYLDSHLTLAALAGKCGVNRTYVSQVMGERLGGFFAYINHCRMAHFVILRVEHPNMSIEEQAIASGFGSRQSYYNVRRQLEQKNDR